MRKIIFFVIIILFLTTSFLSYRIISGEYDKQDTLILKIKDIVPTKLQNKLRNYVYDLRKKLNEERIEEIQKAKLEQGLKGKLIQSKTIKTETDKIRYFLREYFLPFERLDLSYGWRAIQNAKRAHYLDIIDDKADDNGTGRWMLKYGLDLGCSLNMLNAALDSRFISKNNNARLKFNNSIKKEIMEYDININSLSDAYSFCRLINYVQAFLLIDSANKNYGWDISISKALNVWSNGSIIKSDLVNTLYKDYSVDNILDDKKIFKTFNELKPGLIDVLNLSLKNDVSLPCFSEALSYINQISSLFLSTKLIQAQRNQFGSHKISIN